MLHKLLNYRVLGVISIIIALTIYLLLYSDNHDLGQGVRMNHMQFIGSHNSYKKAIQTELFDLLKEKNPNIAGLEYEHLDIQEQLDLGLRKLELDIFYDPDGGRYSAPGVNMILEEAGIEPLAFDENNDLSQPGFKVFHVQDIDFRSHCLLLEQCLSNIKEWSLENPDHHLLVVTINVKTQAIDDPSAVIPLPFSEQAYQKLDKTILDQLGHEKLLRPGQIQGEAPTLNEAILNVGWPTLDYARNKVMFVLDEPMAKIDQYLESTSVKERVFFVNAPAGHPESAFLIINDPIADEELIMQKVSEGYIVRTRADADTKEARLNDYRRFKAAKRSGAHYISTDYYYRTELNPEFIIKFEDNSFARQNPLFNQQK